MATFEPETVLPAPNQTSQITQVKKASTEILSATSEPTSINKSSSSLEKINAAFWLKKLRTALTEGLFEAGIVRQRGQKTESYQWLHGRVDVEGKPVEVEKISQLVGGVGTMIRRDNTIAFFDSNKSPYAVQGKSIRNFIPPVFYGNAGDLIDSYQFVLVSKSQIAGRSAQLIRIESIKRETYNYWVWIDVESGLPLRMVYVNNEGDVAEQVIMTHLSIYPESNESMQELAVMELPEAPVPVAVTQQANNWDISFVPRGFDLVKSDRHHVSISREVSDYYLFSDGLVEFSIYVQRPLGNFNAPVVLTDGATSFVMVHANEIDVTVVGKIPPETGFKIAQGVKAK